MATQTRTSVDERTLTYTLSNVHTVTEAVCEDLEEIVNKCDLSLGATMSARNASHMANPRLLRLLQNDLYRLLYKGLAVEIAFVFHDEEKYGTMDGYMINYVSRYYVQPGERQGTD